jgi:hypothetical protein
MMVTLLEQHVQFDRAVGLEPARLQPLVWTGNLSPTGMEDDGGPLLNAALIVTDSQGRRRSSLPIVFTTRVHDGNVRSLLGADSSASLHVSLEAALPATDMRMLFRFEPSANATPGDLLPIVAWFESLGPGRLLGLWMVDRGRWAVDPQMIPPDHPRIPHAYAASVRVLARIQERSATSFSMPTEIEASAIQVIDAADRLVRGETISGKWHDASVNDDSQLLHYLESSEHGVLLEFTTEYALDIAGTPVMLGRAEYRFMQVKLAGRDAQA